MARHAAEGMTKHLRVVILESILNMFITMPNVVHAISDLLLTLPFSRRYFYLFLSFASYPVIKIWSTLIKPIIKFYFILVIDE